MSEHEEISIDTLALYAMNLLDAEERGEVAAWVRHSPAAQADLARVYSDLATLALSADMHSPPALARQRLLKQVARERRTGSFNPAARPDQAAAPTPFAGYAAQAAAYARENEQPPRPTRRASEEDETRSGFSTAMPYIAWALAACLGFVAYIQYNERVTAEGYMRTAQNELVRSEAESQQARAILETLTAPSAQRVTLTPNSAPPAPSGKVTYMPEKGMLTFIASNMAPLPAEKTYELWLIPAPGAGDPIPAGTFRPDEHGNGSVMLPELPKGVIAKAFGVTIEDVGGSQKPTMPIVLAGA